MGTYRKLYRSTENRVFAGVAGGLAEYLGVSTTLIRILFIILFIIGGGGGFLYLLMWALTPRQPSLLISFDDESSSESTIGRLFKAGLCALILIMVGWAVSDDVWIAAFGIGLAIGLYWFWKSSERGSSSGTESVGEPGRLYRSTRNKKVFGIFGGLAAKLGVDATLLRVIGVVLVFAGVGVLIPIYCVCALIIPKGNDDDPIVERVAII